jgi:hypothetical protein
MIPTPSTEWSIADMEEVRYTVTVISNSQGRQDLINQTDAQAKAW